MIGINMAITSLYPESTAAPSGDSLDMLYTSSPEALNMTENATATDEIPYCGPFLFGLYSVAMGIVGVLGFLGNTLSFLVLRKDRSTPVASFLLQTLAVADNVFLVLWFVHYSVRYCFDYFDIDVKHNSAWLYLRVSTFPLLYISQMETIWLTVVIALNRFMAVCRPYRAPRLCTIYNVYKEVVIVTLFSIVYNIPRAFELKIFTMESGLTFWKRTGLGRNEVYREVYTDALYYLFTFVLPLLILAYVNTRVTIAYQEIRRRKRRMTSRRAENENNITLVMIIVVLIFMLCQAPARIVQIVWGYQFAHCLQYQYYLIHISNTLEVLNSSVNFIVYFAFRKRFRDIIHGEFCPGPLKRDTRDSFRFTTTEGLSLAHFDPAQHGCRMENGANDAVDVNVAIVQDQPLNGSVKMPIDDDDDINEGYALPTKGTQTAH